MGKSPTLEGLRAVFGRPLLGWTELAWRWSFATAGCLLTLLLLFEYLASVPVTKGDLLLLRSGVPWIVLATVRHIVMSGAARFAYAVAILVGAISALWIAAASLGRNATLRFLLDHFGRIDTAADSHGFTGIQPDVRNVSVLPPSSMLALHFLRVGLFIAAVLAIIGAASLSGLVSSERNPQPGLVFLLFLTLLSLIVIVWKTLDWVLSIAAIFCVAEARDTFGSFVAALSFVRERTRSVLATTSLMAVIHLAIFLTASSLVSFPLSLAAIAPRWMIAAAVVFITMVYFAIADFLYLSRLAAYVYILRSPAEPGPSTTLVPESSSLPPARVDDESILSDIPDLASPEPA